MADEDKKQKTDHGHGHSHDHADGHKPAEIVSLGAVTLGGTTYIIDREGQVESGKVTEFGVEVVGGTPVTPTAAWLANPDGTEVCDPVKGEGHDQHWHFNVEPLMPVKKSKFMLKVGDEVAAVDWAKGAAPCNDGIMTVFKATQHVPYIELKLHGDAGDLELFLYKTSNVAGWLSQNKPEPFDVPKETVARITFLSGTGVPEGGKTVELRVRNMDQNEDEAGTPNMRDGKTNYFIFPGESGQDAEWLVGEKNRYVVKVTFEVDGTANECDPFVLVPHEAL